MDFILYDLVLQIKINFIKTKSNDISEYAIKFMKLYTQFKLNHAIYSNLIFNIHIYSTVVTI